MRAVSDDLNGIGQGVSGLAWFVSNIRLKLVSVGISVLMALLLAAGLVGTVASFAKVAEINASSTPEVEMGHFRHEPIAYL